VPVFTAFHTLILSKLPDRFPQLRWGFVETGASWLPYIMHDLGARNMGSGTNISSVGRVIKPADPDLLQKNRMYVACEVHDDLPYITKYVGDDNIVVGSDYGHADTSSVLDALGQLKQQGEREEVSQETLRKIMDDNARALYGL
jgi:predicted TIM-barrel fold metal-dependent hydrolase